jgi:hypothetical protein
MLRYWIFTPLRFGFKIIFVSVICILCLIGILVAILATSGISNPYFTRTAQSSLQVLIGKDFNFVIHDAELSLDGSGNLAFKANNAAFIDKSDPSKMTNINSLKLGFKALPLLLGKFDITSIEMRDVILTQSNQLETRKNDLIQFKKGRFQDIPEFIHQHVVTFKKNFMDKNIDEITIINAKLSPNPSPIQTLSLLKITKNENSNLILNGELIQNNQKNQLTGAITELGFEVTLDKIQYGTTTNAQNLGKPVADFDPITLNGRGDFKITGLFKNKIPKLQFDVVVENFDYRNKKSARILGKAHIRAELTQNFDKIEILLSSITIGDNFFPFSGALAPDAETGHYRFELVSKDATLRPKDSPESKILASMMIAGKINSAAKEVIFSKIGLRTLEGQIYGTGNINVALPYPHVSFAFDIPEMSITHAKQLWPSVVASSARVWMLDHVFDGTLVNSRINMTFDSKKFGTQSIPDRVFLPTPDQFSASFNFKNTRFDLVGDLPPVRKASGVVSVQGANTVIKVDQGTAYSDTGKALKITGFTLNISVMREKPIIADLKTTVSGDTQSIAELAYKKPFSVAKKLDILPSNLSGNASAQFVASFPLRKTDTQVKKTLSAVVDFKNLSISKELNGQKISQATGTLKLSKQSAILNLTGLLNGVPSTIEMVEPMGDSIEKRRVMTTLKLDDKAKSIMIPALNNILQGPITLNVTQNDNNQKIEADLSKAVIALPWAGWTKGANISATATFSLVRLDKNLVIKDLKVWGNSFSISGEINSVNGQFLSADFSNISLNKGDKIAIQIKKNKNVIDVYLHGSRLDLRGLLSKTQENFETHAKKTSQMIVRLKANIDSVTGFGGEQLFDFVATYYGKGTQITSFTAKAKTKKNGSIMIQNNAETTTQNVDVQTSDGGSLLRFINIYQKMQGGIIKIALKRSGDSPLFGEVDGRDFTIIDEPRLKSLIGAPVSTDGKSLSNVTKHKIELSRVKFDRINALIEKGRGYIKVQKGILRSVQIGLSYSGTLYDANGRINIIGTFMPAYGLNSVLSKLPIFGAILGNGRDKGLIGITFKLIGNAKTPDIIVNPISLIAPGIFRQIFEFQ